MTKQIPLALDVDGTFLRTDMFVESFWHTLGRDPKACLTACFKYLFNRPKLKHELAKIAPMRTDLMPVNADVVTLAQAAKDEGREVVLASGSDALLVRQLSKEHGFGDKIFASDGETNMTGTNKGRALTEAYGDHGFDYAGDSRADITVWQMAQGAIVPRGNNKAGNKVAEFDGRWKFRSLIKAIRPHQWVKNVLLFLPLIAAHKFDADNLLVLLLAAMSFSAAASSIYIVNDLLDLEADRLHPKKKYRPFAAGTVPILVGMAACVVLGMFALSLAAWINLSLMGIVALYMSLSLAYSLRLKRLRWVDVFALAALYTLRVIAGAVAVNVEASGWLIAFIFPLFLTLGCVKRLTELALATSDERLPGRGYGRGDRGDMVNLASVGAFFALLMFFLYSFSDQSELLYVHSWQLWFGLIPICAWMVRMIYLGWAGKQDYDPIVFALRDKIGISLIIVTLIIVLQAAGLLVA